MSGLHATPAPWSSRLVFLTVYLTDVILFVAYSAIFFSFLAVRRHDLPFTDFHGLLADGTYRLGVMEGSADKDFFTVKPIYNEQLIRVGLVRVQILTAANMNVTVLWDAEPCSLVVRF
jgi:hypothetical protein